MGQVHSTLQTWAVGNWHWVLQLVGQQHPGLMYGLYKQSWETLDMLGGWETYTDCISQHQSGKVLEPMKIGDSNQCNPLIIPNRGEKGGLTGSIHTGWCFFLFFFGYYTNLPNKGNPKDLIPLTTLNVQNSFC